MYIEIHQEKQKLDNLFKKVSVLDDDEMKSHWSRYLCVLVSGFLENSLRTMLSHYTLSKSHPNVANYVSKQIKGITNLKEKKVKQLLGSFSKDWQDIFEKNISGEQKAAVDSIVANRHLIVHGVSVGITYSRVSEYYKHIKDVISIIHDTCINSP